MGYLFVSDFKLYPISKIEYNLKSLVYSFSYYLSF